MKNKFVFTITMILMVALVGGLTYGNVSSSVLPDASATSELTQTPQRTEVVSPTVESTQETIQNSEDPTTTTITIATTEQEEVLATDIYINMSGLFIEENTEMVLKAYVLPVDAADKTIIYESSDESIFTIDEDGNIKALKEGKADAILSTKDGRISRSCTISVVIPVKVTDIRLNSIEKTLEEGKTFTLIPTISPSNADNKTVIYTSSDAKVATVNSSGKVTAKAAGSAVITATTKDGGFKAECKVTVISTERVTGLELGDTELTLELLQKHTMRVSIFPSNAKNKAVTYSSSNRSVVTIDKNGNITTKGVGTSVIKVKTTDGGFVKECKVTVILPKSGTSPYFLYVEKGSFTFTVYGKNADGNYDYNTPIRQNKTAIGKNDLTPAGVFTLTTKERWHIWGSGAATQYTYKYTTGPDRFIHSPLYDTTDNTKMKHNYYNWGKNDLGIGTAQTGGCLLMTTENALWVYDNCPSGTILYIVNGAPKGTSSPNPPAIVVPGQDPTDPLLKK